MGAETPNEEHPMSKLKLMSCAGALVGLGAFVAAQAGTPADYFNKYDANADGVVTEAEFVAVKTASGKVSAEEATAKFTKIAGTDGQMTLTELETAMNTAQKAKAKEKGCSDKKDRSA